jgi:hypothetical protein
MFEETEKHVPNWASCTAQQLKNLLTSLKLVGWAIANDAHKHQSGLPLRILGDEKAEQYPATHASKERDLDRALTRQSVGISLGFIASSLFRYPDGSDLTTTVYAYKLELPVEVKGDLYG